LVTDQYTMPKRSEYPWETQFQGTVVIPPDLLDFLREIANDHTITADDVYKKALQLGLQAMLVVDEGGGVIFEDETGQQERVNIWEEGSLGSG